MAWRPSDPPRVTTLSLNLPVMNIFLLVTAGTHRYRGLRRNAHRAGERAGTSCNSLRRHDSGRIVPGTRLPLRVSARLPGHSRHRRSFFRSVLSAPSQETRSPDSGSGVRSLPAIRPRAPERLHASTGISPVPGANPHIDEGPEVRKGKQQQGTNGRGEPLPLRAVKDEPCNADHDCRQSSHQQPDKVSAERQHP